MTKLSQQANQGIIVGRKLTTLTQPLLSCIIMANMKRASMPVVFATDKISVLMSAISAAELLGTSQLFSQDCCMMGVLYSNLKESVLAVRQL